MKNDSEFWLDDARQIQQREHEQRTGLRMPSPAQKRSVTQNQTPRVNTPARRASPHTWRVIALAAIVAVIVGTAGVYWYRLPIITLAEFQQLESGMSTAQCNAIVGANGFEIMASEATDLLTKPGIPSGVAFFDSTTLIQWKNRDGSNGVALFVNDQLLTKAQAQLH